MNESDQDLFIKGITYLSRNIEYRDDISKSGKARLEAWHQTYHRTINRFKGWMERENPPIEVITPIFVNNKIAKDLEIVFLKIFLEKRQIA